MLFRNHIMALDLQRSMTKQGTSTAGLLPPTMYHRPLTAKTSISAGLSAGITSVNLDRSKIEWGNLDPNDPAIGISNGEIKKIKPEIGAGLWLYSARYFVGVSVLNIIPGKAKFVTDDKYGPATR